MNLCINLYKKYKEVILYLLFGVLTTILNILVFWLCNDIVKIEYKISNIIAWILSVLFAFITNKLIVFKSKNHSKKETTKEALSFLAARIFSLIVDMALMVIMIDMMSLNSLIAKMIANVVVVIINYILSKFLIFRK